MLIIRTNIIPPKGYKAMTVWPFLFVRGLMMPNDYAHEEIHAEQQKELLIVGFYIWYIVEFLVRLACTRNWHRAYRGISLEREAYGMEGDREYLSSRKHYSFIKYFTLW